MARRDRAKPYGSAKVFAHYPCVGTRKDGSDLRGLLAWFCVEADPLRHREVGQKRLGGAPPPPATPSCAVAGRCAYNLWISDINIRARMVRGRAPDTDARPIPAT